MIETGYSTSGSQYGSIDRGEYNEEAVQLGRYTPSSAVEVSKVNQYKDHMPSPKMDITSAVLNIMILMYKSGEIEVESIASKIERQRDKLKELSKEEQHLNMALVGLRKEYQRKQDIEDTKLQEDNVEREKAKASSVDFFGGLTEIVTLPVTLAKMGVSLAFKAIGLGDPFKALERIVGDIDKVLGAPVLEYTLGRSLDGLFWVPNFFGENNNDRVSRDEFERRQEEKREERKFLQKRVIENKKDEDRINGIIDVLKKASNEKTSDDVEQGEDEEKIENQFIAQVFGHQNPTEVEKNNFFGQAFGGQNSGADGKHPFFGQFHDQQNPGADEKKGLFGKGPGDQNSGADGKHPFFGQFHDQQKPGVDEKKGLFGRGLGDRNSGADEKQRWGSVKNNELMHKPEEEQSTNKYLEQALSYEGGSERSENYIKAIQEFLDKGLEDVDNDFQKYLQYIPGYAGFLHMQNQINSAKMQYAYALLEGWSMELSAEFSKENAEASHTNDLLRTILKRLTSILEVMEQIITAHYQSVAEIASNMRV